MVTSQICLKRVEFQMISRHVTISTRPIVILATGMEAHQIRLVRVKIGSMENRAVLKRLAPLSSNKTQANTTMITLTLTTAKL